jgi:hypothetical protein
MKRIRIHPSKRRRFGETEPTRLIERPADKRRNAPAETETARRKETSSAKPDNPSICDVGYGKPPKHTRFKPGQSGNPSGRPAGSKNRVAALARELDDLEATILEEANRDVKLREGDREITIPMKRAILRSAMNNAVKGSARAQHLSTGLIAKAESSRERQRLENAAQALELKKTYQAEWDRRMARGLSEDILPRPQDIVINLVTGAAEIRGPINKEEAAMFDQCRSLQKSQLDELHYWEEQLGDPRCVDRNQARKEVEASEGVLQIFEYALRGNRDALALICRAHDDVMTRLHQKNLV